MKHFSHLAALVKTPWLQQASAQGLEGYFQTLDLLKLNTAQDSRNVNGIQDTGFAKIWERYIGYR